MIKHNSPFALNQVSYPRTASELCGEIQDLELWEKGQKQNQYLLDQTYKIADQLEAEGIEAYQHQDLTLFGLHSKSYKKLPNFRNITFLPYVARKNRNKILKPLEFYLQRHPNARFATITSGVRCTLEELPDRAKWMHRQISKCNATKFMKDARAKFVFRSTELGEVYPLGSDGEVSCHPHCHTLLVLDRFLPKDQWSTLLERIHGFFGTHYQDCGKIKNVRELVKYCVKPSDFEHLSSKDVVSLYHATKNLRLVESLGSFRECKRKLKEDRMKLVRRKGVLKKVPNWVGGATVDKATRCFQPIREDDPVVPQIVAWCVPSRVFTPVTEPVFLVHGLQGSDPNRVFGWDEVKRMEHSIKVHTKTLTVFRKYENSGKAKNIEYEYKEKIPI